MRCKYRRGPRVDYNDFARMVMRFMDDAEVRRFVREFVPRNVARS